MEGEASPEEGGEGGDGGVPRGLQGVGRRLPDPSCRAPELQGEQPPASGGEAGAGHPEHHRVDPVAAAAGVVRVPHPVHGRRDHSLLELHVHWAERLPAHAGICAGDRHCTDSCIAPRIRAVFHVLHDQRRLQLRSADVPHERSRNGATRYAHHLTRLQRRVVSPCRLLRRLVLMVVLPLLQFCSKAFGDYAAQSEVIDILEG